jgi:uracil-DNA glycosylase
MKGKQFWVNQLGKEWALRLKPVLKSEYMKKLMDYLTVEYSLQKIKPYDKNEIFQAFRLTPYSKLKIVIIGQEPYHIGGANGLAYGENFATFRNSALCKIVDNIERIYYPDEVIVDFDNSLEQWAKQGVLLLNTALTTRLNEPGSHRKPWRRFVETVLNEINDYNPGTIFMLWGDAAQKLIPYLSDKHYVLKYEHPIKAVQEYKDWNCPNFEEADKICIDLYGETIKW